jgi:MFS family permease
MPPGADGTGAPASRTSSMPAVVAPLAALLLGASILLLGNGLQSLLLPIRATMEGFSTHSIGFMGAAYPAGFILSCLVTPHLVKRVGHIRTFAVFAAVAGVTVLAYGSFVVPALWVAFRMISGFCFAGLFMVIESWLNEAAQNSNRGQVFSLYMVIQLSSITIGQILIMVADPARFELFALSAAAIILGLVPVGLTTSKAPPPIEIVRLRLDRLYRMSPVGVLGCFFVGMANGAFGSLGPVFAGGAGLSVAEIALFMSAALIGGTLAQVPIGRMSDRMDRRRVIAFSCLLAIAAGLLLMLAGDARAGGVLLPSGPFMTELPRGSLIGLALLFGAGVYPLYGLCTAHTNDFVDRSEFVEASSGLLLTWALGATVGPLLAAALMENVGLAGLFVFIAAVHTGFAGFTLWRMTRRTALPPEVRENFVLTAAASRTTPVSTTLDPRSFDHPDAAGTTEPEGGGLGQTSSLASTAPRDAMK